MGLIHHNHRPGLIYWALCHSALLAFQFVKSELILGNSLLKRGSLHSLYFLRFIFLAWLKILWLLSLLLSWPGDWSIVFPVSSRVSPHNNWMMDDPGKSLTGHLLAEKVILGRASLAPATSLVKMIDYQTREFADGARGAHLLIKSRIVVKSSQVMPSLAQAAQGPSAPNWMIKRCN